MAITKGHTSFFVLNFWNLKFYFFSKNVAVVSRKAVKFESPGQNFSEMSLVISSRKTGKVLEVDQEQCGWIGYVKL